MRSSLQPSSAYLSPIAMDHPRRGVAPPAVRSPGSRRGPSAPAHRASPAVGAHAPVAASAATGAIPPPAWAVAAARENLRLLPHNLSDLSSLSPPSGVGASLAPGLRSIQRMFLMGIILRIDEWPTTPLLIQNCCAVSSP